MLSYSILHAPNVLLKVVPHGRWFESGHTAKAPAKNNLSHSEQHFTFLATAPDVPFDMFIFVLLLKMSF